MSAVDLAVAAHVRSRADNRCEYCRMHQSLQGGTFHVDHVRPASRGGDATLENLAWSCPSCNLLKSDRTHAIDPDSGRFVPLFNPRVGVWNEHFAWSGEQLIARTPTARATVVLLKLNVERRLFIRRAEARLSLFPP